MIYITVGQEPDFEEIIEEAIKTGSEIVNVAEEKFINYDNVHDEVYTEEVGSYEIKVSEVASMSDVIEYCNIMLKEAEEEIGELKLKLKGKKWN